MSSGHAVGLIRCSRLGRARQRSMPGVLLRHPLLLECQAARGAHGEQAGTSGDRDRTHWIRAADARDSQLLHDATVLLLRVDQLQNVLLRLGGTGLLGEL